MSELVALHTQALAEPLASMHLRLLGRALEAGRLNKGFPDRRALAGTLKALAGDAHHGLYEQVFVDSRTGLPNLASLTRVLADREVGVETLRALDDQAALDERRGEAEVFERLARKRRYYELLSTMELAPVDRHRVWLRRHEPGQSRASFRVELTKLSASGCYVHLVVELTQTASLWAQTLVSVDAAGEVAQGTEALRGIVYRFADFDAETLFIRLHELEGVSVERVQRGVIGPALWAIPVGGRLHHVAEPGDDALARTWSAWLPGAAGAAPHLVVGLASDTAANDVREESSNDPLMPLLADNLTEAERARYSILRARHPFRVYKDRKFVVTGSARPLVEGVCSAAGTRNLIYELTS